MIFDAKYTKRGVLCLDGFVFGRSLRIDKHHWKEINKLFQKEGIKRALLKTIRKHSLPLPTSIVQESELHEGIKTVIRTSSRSLIQMAPGRVITRKQYSFPVSDYYIQSSSAGNVVSDYFHRAERLRCGTFKFLSPHDAWKDDEMLLYCLNALWTMKLPQVNETTLFNCLALRQYAASQFRVTAAKAVYDLFSARDVLDTSMGWGDRLAAFCFSEHGRGYWGVDPNFRLHDGYVKQVDMYGGVEFGITAGDEHYAWKRISTTENKIFMFNVSGSENESLDYPKEKFDLMFTSPPYFETERYGREEDKEQSWVKYKEVDNWLDKFLFETIDRAWYSLKPDAFLALNIADLGVSYKASDICNPMNDYISSLPNASYSGCLGLRLSARPHTSLEKRIDGEKSIFVEPIWIWRKGRWVSIDDLVKRFKGGGM